jgi:6-phospho-beta-glucosidase
MKLEAEAGSALDEGGEQLEDPFHAATGYHRIAIDVITALVSDHPARIVLNVSNHGAIEDLEADDVVEVPCLIDRNGPVPTTIGHLPPPVRGLIQAVKEYERLTIQATIEKSLDRARLAQSVYPVVGEWESADRLLSALTKAEDPGLRYLTGR